MTVSAAAVSPAPDGGAETGFLALLPLPALILAGSEAGTTIVGVNPALLALTGFDEAALVGSGIEVLACHHGSHTGWTPLREALARGEAQSAELLFGRNGGASFWGEIHLTVLPGEGSPRFLGQIVDVTRRRDAEDALALSRQREALGLLTNSVAHEFNNFLQILIGYIDGLKRRLGEHPEPFVQRAMSRSTDATERAAVLTRQLLAFSRRIAPDVRAIDLDAVVAEAAASIRPTLPARIRLDVGTTPDLPWAIANPTQVELALRHLVANACEAMPERGTIALATFRIAPGERSMQHPGEGAVGLTVTDTGTGMSPEMLARALAPFATSHEAGRGAGLAIVHGLMKRQNGTISLDSRPGEGTQVRLVFPAATRRDVA